MISASSPLTNDFIPPSLLSSRAADKIQLFQCRNIPPGGSKAVGPLPAYIMGRDVLSGLQALQKPHLSFVQIRGFGFYCDIYCDIFSTSGKRFGTLLAASVSVVEPGAT